MSLNDTLFNLYTKDHMGTYHPTDNTVVDGVDRNTNYFRGHAWNRDTNFPTPEIHYKFEETYLMSTRHSCQHLVAVLLDESGSMSSYSPLIRTALKKEIAASGKQAVFIAFSHVVHVSNNLDKIPFEKGNTYIAQAFTALERVVAAHPDVKSVDVILISDGADTLDMDASAVHKRMFTQEGRGGANPFFCRGLATSKRSKFITVGVGAGFPTSLIFPWIRDAYQTDARISVAPVVIPLVKTTEVNDAMRTVFETLALPMEMTLWRRVDGNGFPVLDLEQELTSEAVRKLCAAVVSVCMDRVVAGRGSDGVVRLIDSARTVILEAESALVQQCRRLNTGKSADMMKTKMTLTAVIQRLNELANSAAVTNHFSRYQDKDLSELFTWGNVLNHTDITAKALVYRKLNFQRTLENLDAFIKRVQSGGITAEVGMTCVISMETQQELLEEAAAAFAPPNPGVYHISNMAGVIGALPLIGLPVYIHRVGGLEMNPWLTWVTDVDYVLKYLSLRTLHTMKHRTVTRGGEVPVETLFEDSRVFLSAYESSIPTLQNAAEVKSQHRDVVCNSIIPMSFVKKLPQQLNFALTTYLVTGSTELFDSRFPAALWAGTMVHVLSDPEVGKGTVPEWARELFGVFGDLYKATYEAPPEYDDDEDDIPSNDSYEYEDDDVWEDSPDLLANRRLRAYIAAAFGEGEAVPTTKNPGAAVCPPEIAVLSTTSGDPSRKEMVCESLTQYIFALIIGIVQNGKKLTVAELRNRFLHALAEMCLRCPKRGSCISKLTPVFARPFPDKPFSFDAKVLDEADRKANEEYCHAVYTEWTEDTNENHVELLSDFYGCFEQDLSVEETMAKMKQTIVKTLRKREDSTHHPMVDLVGVTGSLDVYYWQLKPRTLANVFVGIGILAGLPKEEVVKAVQAGRFELYTCQFAAMQSRSSMEMHAALGTGEIPLLTKEEVVSRLKPHFISKRRELVIEAVMPVVQEKLVRRTFENHLSTFIIPKEYVEDLNRLDPAMGEYLCLSSHGLSLTRCMSPNCPHFLHYFGKERVVRGRKIMAAELERHLVASSIPGSTRIMVETGKHISSGDVATMILSGKALKKEQFSKRTEPIVNIRKKDEVFSALKPDYLVEAVEQTRIFLRDRNMDGIAGAALNPKLLEIVAKLKEISREAEEKKRGCRVF